MDIRGNRFILGYRAPAAHAGRVRHLGSGLRSPPAPCGPAQGMAKKPNPDAHTLCETEAGGRSSGKDIKFNQPAATGGHGEYKRASLHTISAGFGIAYELLTGDLSQVNYSSIRAGLVETALMLVSNGAPQPRVPRRLVACDWPYWG